LKAQGIPGWRMTSIPLVFPKKEPIAQHPYAFKSKPVIGVMGKFSHYKGFDVWIKAFRILKNQGYHAQGKIAGESPLIQGPFAFLKDPQYVMAVKKFGLRRACRLGAKSRCRLHLEGLVRSLDLDQDIQFCGWVPRNEFLGSLDILCIPSRIQSFGRVFLEGWSNAKPIIASNIDALREVGLHKHNALMVPPENPEALAQAMAYLMDHPQEAHMLARQGLEDLNKYGVHRIVPQIENVLYSVIEKKKKENYSCRKII
jgi:glycosyltransferase involved in cell wall biosynthesis